MNLTPQVAGISNMETIRDSDLRKAEMAMPSKNWKLQTTLKSAAMDTEKIVTATQLLGNRYPLYKSTSEYSSTYLYIQLYICFMYWYRLEIKWKIKKNRNKEL
jgi:hypothetical protein